MSSLINLKPKLESVTTSLESVTAEPENATTKLEIVTTKLESVPANPENATTKLETVTAKPESKVEIFLEQRKVAFLSPSKICENSNFFYCAPLKIQIFANFAG